MTNFPPSLPQTYNARYTFPGVGVDWFPLVSISQISGVQGKELAASCLFKLYLSLYALIKWESFETPLLVISPVQINCFHTSNHVNYLLNNPLKFQLHPRHLISLQVRQGLDFEQNCHRFSYFLGPGLSLADELYV